MLSKFILSVYGLLIEVSLLVSLVAAVVTGFMFSDITGALIGFLIWMLASVTIFGVLLLLLDVRDRLSRIESTCERLATDNTQQAQQ